ncbi:MAG: hypothetical protein CL912_09070 [Deltaproteobacteria bacterium]|nr:hypothetical protein [Deltaproteobacteria bacterium]
MNAPEIPNFHRLRRSKLRNLISKDLDIRWNKRLKDIVLGQDGKSVTAVFEDGEHAVGRLIIGADGARSTVRSILLGPEFAASNRLPYSATFLQSKFTSEQALFLRSFHPLYIAAPHPEGYFAFFGLQDAPEVDKPEDWTFSSTFLGTRRLNNETSKGRLLGIKRDLRRSRRNRKDIANHGRAHSNGCLRIKLRGISTSQSGIPALLSTIGITRTGE